MEQCKAVRALAVRVEQLAARFARRPDRAEVTGRLRRLGADLETLWRLDSSGPKAAELIPRKARTAADWMEAADAILHFHGFTEQGRKIGAGGTVRAGRLVIGSRPASAAPGGVESPGSASAPIVEKLATVTGL